MMHEHGAFTLLVRDAVGYDPFTLADSCQFVIKFRPLLLTRFQLEAVAEIRFIKQAWFLDNCLQPT